MQSSEVSLFTALDIMTTDVVSVGPNSTIEEAADLFERWSKTLDADERNRMLKEHSIVSMRQAFNIIIPVTVSSRFWWPWIKNYSGEMDLGYPDETGWGEIPKYLWIDRDLKEQIIGRRD